MKTITPALVCALLAACGSSASSEHAAEPAATTPAASSGSEANAASSTVEMTGTWSIAGTPFTPANALTYTNPDGSYEVVLSAPAVDCDFVRHGGVPPADLRQVFIHYVRWNAGVAMTSSGGSMDGQVAFSDGNNNYLANGTVTPMGEAPAPGGTGRIAVAASYENGSEGNGEVVLQACP